MPTYGYECAKCRDQFEVVQRMTEDPLSIHEGCGGQLRRLLYPVGIVFKGPGFYVNDYARAGKDRAEKPAESKPEAKSETAPAPKADAAAAKPEKKAEAASTASE